MKSISRHIFFLLFASCCLHTAVFPAIDTNTVSYLNYIQNKGQFHSNILFQAGFRGGTVFLEKNAFTFAFYPTEGVDRHHHWEHSSDTATFHTVRMQFENGLPATELIPSGKQSHYLNYFRGKDPAKWAKEVPVYNAVQYQEKYPGISVKAFGEGNDMRYDFLVQPGADISRIRLKFEGQNDLKIRNGELVIGTAVGEILQKAPRAYQVVSGKIKEVSCEYVLEKNVLGFKITGNYNKDLPLIIDPTLVFATFSGSLADNWGMTATYDGDGNAYTAGITFDVGYPTTTGAYQVSYAGGIADAIYPFGGFDISVSKFNASGTNLLYATYLGGSNNELPVSIVADNFSNLYVLGKTYSSDYPVTGAAFDNSYNGGCDLVLSMLSSDGSALSASTYVGGTLDDGVNIDAYEPTLASLKRNYADDGRGGILLDNQGNVYVGTCTMSSDFPVTSGCLQSSLVGMQDGCVFKMPANLSSMSFCTYLGGSQNDAAYNIALDSKNRLYVTGGTESSNFPVTGGAFHTTYAGSIDGFVTHLNLTGSGILQSTFVGTSSYDQSFFVQVDKYDGVYLYGQTDGAYPVSVGVYSNPSSGQFIHKLDSNLAVTAFSTVFGNSSVIPNIVPSAFLVDNCQNIYVSGWGGTLGGYNPDLASMFGMPLTPDAFQASTDGGDFYFLVLDKNAIALKYATYFGGNTINEHVDGGTSRFDKSGVIYQAICGGCGGQSSMPTTPGVWSNTNNSPNCNNALVKFSFDMEITIAQMNTVPLNAEGCAPLIVNFQNNSINSIQYEWVFGDGMSSTLEEPTHTYTTPGTYEVMLIAIDSSTCNIRDTVYAEIIVHPPIDIDPMPPITLCAADTFYLSASSPGTVSYTWSPATGLNNPSISNPFGPAVSSQTYTVTVSNGTCEASDSVHVEVLPEVQAQANTNVTNNSGCAPLTVGFFNLSQNSSSYQWFFGDGGSSSLTEPTHTYTTAGTYQVMLVAGNPGSCNTSDTVYITITVAAPLSLTVPPVISICEYDTFQLSATSPGALTFLWSPAAGLSDPTLPDPTGIALTAQSYTVTASNGICEAIDSTQLFVIEVLEVQVNTGLPNNSGCAPLTVSFTNPGGGDTYQWFFGDGGTSALATPTHIYTIPGIFDVMMIASDPATCNISDTAYAQVVVAPPVTINPMSLIEICKYDTFQLHAITSGAFSYSWSPAAGLSDATLVNPTGIALASQTYTLTASNGVCDDSEPVSILVNENNVSISVDMLQFCTDTSADLYVDTVYASYLWNNGQTGATITISQTGTYYVEATDFKGCKATDSIEVTFFSLADLVGSDTLVCRGEAVQLQAVEGNYSYSWSPASSLSNSHVFNPYATPSSTTIYTVSIAAGPCSLSDTIRVTVPPDPALSASPDGVWIMPGEEVELFASSDTLVHWSPAEYLNCMICPAPIATPDTDMVYCATVYDEFGCVYNDSVHIYISPAIYVPNAFTPNAGSINSIFRPVFVGYKELEVLIFNRWGEEIYKWNTLDGGWDGTYKGKRVQQDVYIYKLRALDYRDNEIQKSGTVTVIR